MVCANNAISIKTHVTLVGFIFLAVCPCSEKKEKQSCQWQPTDYGTNTAEKRMPLEAAEHQVDCSAGQEEESCTLRTKRSIGFKFSSEFSISPLPAFRIMA
jgi:hypothetical protein